MALKSATRHGNRYAASEGDRAPAGEAAAGGRVFYAAIGGVKNFDDPQFVRLLQNAVYWAAGKPAPNGSPALD